MLYILLDILCCQNKILFTTISIAGNNNECYNKLPFAIFYFEIIILQKKLSALLVGAHFVFRKYCNGLTQRLSALLQFNILF